MIKCMSWDQMEKLIQIIDNFERIKGMIVVHATTGDVFWKWNTATELFCRVAS